MFIAPFRFTVYRALYSCGYEDRPRLYKERDGEWKRIRCNIDDLPALRPGAIEDVREEIHGYLCRKVYMYEKKTGRVTQKKDT